MRIIAGKFRGRKILPPASDLTRPITDRVKQSLFDILAPRIANATIYDCFAGTGSMGLESLSRDAAMAIFFEMDRSAQRLLRQNITAFGVESASRVIAGDIFRLLGKSSDLPKADIIFLDPPYRMLREQPEKLQSLASELADRLNPDGLLVFRHDASDSLTLPPLICQDERTYGGMTLEFLALHPRQSHTTGDAPFPSTGNPGEG
jgi:16S rRNA (guanine(966)-N(2))-methyltransferase RsmD